MNPEVTMEARAGTALMIRPVSAPLLGYRHFVDLCRSGARLALRRRRDPARVAEEYERGVWGALLADRRWERAADLTDFLLGRDNGLRLCKVGGRAVLVPQREYYRVRMQALTALMRGCAGEADPLIEFGCGAGYNLLTLATTGHWRTLVGFDISPNAVSVARQVAAHFGLAGLRFDVSDVTLPGHPAFACATGRTVFTYLCLEQVPRAVPQAIESLLAARPRRVIHIESAAELLDLRRPADWSNYLYVRSVDYQRCLRATLRTLAGQGRVRIVEERRLDWAPTLHNDTSLTVWEPTERM